MQPYPPLQTLLAAAALRERGISVALFDPTFDTLPRRVSPRRSTLIGPAWPWFAKTILTSSPRCVWGAIANSHFRWLPRRARRGVPIAAHGSDASDHVQEYLDAGFDSVLIGEVETTLVELARRPAARFDSRARLSRCVGPFGATRRASFARIWTRFRCPPGTWSTWINTGRPGMAAHGYFSLNMVSSRGCPYRCNWCAKPIYGNSYHARPPCVRRVGDASSEGQVSAGPYLVRRRYFRALAQVDPALSPTRWNAWARRCRSRCSRAAI